MKIRYRTYMKHILLIITAAVLVGTILTGCSLNRWFEVEPGEYVFIQARGGLGQLVYGEIRQLVIDRDERLASFSLVDGTEIVTSFTPRKRAEWPSGCPSNIPTRMEILDLEGDTLTIGSITFVNPVLVRDCPRNPERVVLREDGDIGGGGSACQIQDRCLIFGRE
jgi:hypothetical protein